MAQPNRQVTFAICGLGRAGNIHLGNLYSNTRARLKYVVDPKVETARAIVEKYHLEESCSVVEIGDVLADAELDAVVISSPTFTHEELVCKSLKAGKAVFCEKPIAESVDKARICYQVAKENNVTLFCSFNRRYDPSVRRLYDATKENKIGKILTVTTCSRDNPFPSLEYIRISGGFFHDCAVHDIDLVTWILGEYPTRVFVMAHCHDPEYKALGDVDTASINLEYASGSLAVIQICRHSVYGYDQRVEVHGTNGMLRSENQRPTNFEMYNVSGLQVEPIKYSFPERYLEAYKIALDNFLDVLQGKAELTIAAEDVLNGSLIAEACHESLTTKLPVIFTPVKL